MAEESSRRHAQVVHVSEVPGHDIGQGKLRSHARGLGRAAGGKALGCSHFELEPGKTAFPYHFHSAVEEALFVLEGSGKLRVGKEQVAVRAGDYVALPPGPDFTHALTNDGAGPLRYLCFSCPATPVTLDIVGYPDSKKISFAAGVEPGKVAWRDGAWIVKLIKEEQPPVGYFDDEPLWRPSSNRAEAPSMAPM